MGQSFSAALDQRSAQRDFEITAGDDFTVTLTVYATDTPDDVNPLDLTGDTLTLRLGYYGWTHSEIIGVASDASTFTFTDAFTRRRGQRVPYRIVLTRAGRTYTIAHGIITIDFAEGYPAIGFCDYGWWWSL